MYLIVKVNCEWSEILPYIQANRLTSCRKTCDSWVRVKGHLITCNSSSNQCQHLCWFPTRQDKHPHMQLQERNPDLREPKSFMTAVHMPDPLLWRETLSLSSKAVHYTNILAKMVHNKSSQCLCLQHMQKHKRPSENGLQHLPWWVLLALSSKMFILPLLTASCFDYRDDCYLRGGACQTWSIFYPQVTLFWLSMEIALKPCL